MRPQFSSRALYVVRTWGRIMTFRFSGGNGGGRESEDVLSRSRPRTRSKASGGVRVAERSTVEEADEKTGASARAGSRQTSARRMPAARRSTTHVKSEPHMLRTAAKRWSA